MKTFTEICRKVCFAVDDYNEIEFILANGYLAYVFAEYAVASDAQGSHEYSQLCRNNLYKALLRLPLLLPACMEAIAALALGVGDLCQMDALRCLLNLLTGILCDREFQSYYGLDF